MRTGRPPRFVIELSEIEQQELERLATSRSVPQGLARRAKVVLLSAEGNSGIAIAEELEMTAATVGYWRRRFHKDRLAGLHDEQRPGRPRVHDDERIAELIRKTLDTKPENATHWTVRRAAKETGISKSTVARMFSLFGVQPHRSKSFKLSNDPYFVDKVADIVGLYLNPPEKALVLCVDEKSQIQALERSQPMLPMGLGYVEGLTHDYYRHGTTTLFAALDAATGKVIAQCKPRHRHQEFLGFLGHLEKSIPKDLAVHVIMDNYATHKHPKVRQWFADHPRYTIHFTPTYSSWLNQVERWFGIITQRAIRRGSFKSVKDLTRKIDRFVTHYNTESRPFIWTATHQSIMAKLEKLCSVIYGTGH